MFIGGLGVRKLSGAFIQGADEFSTVLTVWDGERLVGLTREQAQRYSRRLHFPEKFEERDGRLYSLPCDPKIKPKDERLGDPGRFSFFRFLRFHLPSIILHVHLEIGLGMLADRADKVSRKLFSLIFISADPAAPDCLSGLTGRCGRL